MRSQDLIGRQVVDLDGNAVGLVLDLRLESDVGPSAHSLGGPMPDLVVVAVLVGRRQLGARWGYLSHELQGPWLLKTALRWWHRDARIVPWESVELPARATAPLTIRRRFEDLEQLLRS